MANNFFELVNDGFFYPFANNNKRANYSLLQLLNNKMSLDNLQVSRDDIIEWITDYVDNCPIDLYNDETNSLDGDIRTFASDKIRYFVKYGWLIEDYEGIKITYQLDENGIKILSAMENAVKDDTKSLEFSGFVFNIYNSLYYFKYDHSVDIIEQVYIASKELNSMLRGLNVNIKKYLTKLIRENKAMPKEILETIYFNYQKKVVLKAFKNFREKDNPSKYKLYIEDKIDDLFKEENFLRMINNYLKVKHDSENSVQYYDEAKEFFETRLLYIREQFEEIEDYIQMLDRRNTKYISTARSRLNFLLNEETDLEGRIVKSLKGLGKVNDDFFDDDFFNLCIGSNIDEFSLYKPVIRKSKPKVEPIIEEKEINIEEIERLQNKLFAENFYSVNEINKFALKCLNDKDQIHARDINVEKFSDILKIFLIQVYSENSSINYKVRFLDEKYKILDYQMDDYILIRKER